MWQRTQIHWLLNRLHLECIVMKPLLSAFLHTVRNSLKLNNGTQKKCFIFGFDGRSDRPDPLHLTVYIPIAWAEIPVRIEQIYLYSPDSSLPQWYWSVTMSWVSLLKQRVNLADAFPFLAAGRKAPGFTAQTSLQQGTEWKHFEK